MSILDLTAVSGEDLREAGKRLQRAHDYIEVHGFAIERYGWAGRACCYIGSMKVANGESSSFFATSDRSIQGALAILDKVALDRGYNDDMFMRKLWAMPMSNGKRVELMGFEEIPSSLRGDFKAQAELVLPVFRQAIREVIELERKDDSRDDHARRHRRVSASGSLDIPIAM